MPTHHIGWTKLVGVIFLLGKMLIGWKTFAIVYPGLTFVGIIMTGNHFIIDVIGGIGDIFVAYLLYEVLLHPKDHMFLPSAAVTNHRD